MDTPTVCKKCPRQENGLMMRDNSVQILIIYYPDYFFFFPFIVICETWESSNIVNPQCVSYYPDYLLMFLSCHVHVASDLSTILDMIQPPAANEKCIVLLLVDK